MRLWIRRRPPLRRTRDSEGFFEIIEDWEDIMVTEEDKDLLTRRKREDIIGEDLSLIIGDHLERTSADKIIISENSMEIGKIMEIRKLLLKINCCC